MLLPQPDGPMNAVTERPSWPPGARGGRVHWKLRDEFGFFGDEDSHPER